MTGAVNAEDEAVKNFTTFSPWKCMAWCGFTIFHPGLFHSSVHLKFILLHKNSFNVEADIPEILTLW
jgi:hypothetical protein